MSFSNLAPLGVYSLGALIIIFLSLSSKPDRLLLGAGLSSSWPENYFQDNPLIDVHEARIQQLDIIRSGIQEKLLNDYHATHSKMKMESAILLDDFAGKKEICDPKNRLSTAEIKTRIVEKILPGIWQDPTENVRLQSPGIQENTGKHSFAELSWTDRWSGDQLTISGTLILENADQVSGVFRVSFANEMLTEYANLRNFSLPKEIVF